MASGVSRPPPPPAPAGTASAARRVGSRPGASANARTLGCSVPMMRLISSISLKMKRFTEDDKSD
jgi:hypothetical protein